MNDIELQEAIDRATKAVERFYSLLMTQELITSRKYLRELRELQLRKAQEK